MSEQRNRNIEPQLRWNGNVALATGLTCPWCTTEISNDPRETADGWQLICGGPHGCHHTLLICDEG
jgi:hypothetical protein